MNGYSSYEVARYTPEEIWREMWPDIPFEDASPGDVRLVTDHANSLNTYLETQ